MSVTASDIRLIKKAVCDLVSPAAGVGEVIPSRQVFADKAEYWATVSPKTTQKAAERDGIACAMVHLRTPRRRTDPQNENVFEMDFAVRVFREAFPVRVDQTSSPDAFRRKLIASEDAFDAAVVDIGLRLRRETAVAGLSAGTEATILPIDTTDGEIAFGPPDFLPTVEGHHIDLTVSVEVVHDAC